MSVKEEIANIGKEMVFCNSEACKNQKDVKPVSPEKGVMPRCLYLQERNGNGKNAIVIGINPGLANPVELEEYSSYYLTNKGKENCAELVYKSMCEYFEKTYIPDVKHPYYVKLINILDKLGYTGNILWTEMYNCEHDNGKQGVHAATRKACFDKHLSKQIAIAKDYEIFAVSVKAYGFLSKMYPDNVIIGFPHPTARQVNGGCRAAFDRLMSDANLLDKYKAALEKLKYDSNQKKHLDWTNIYRMKK
jgi:hypothetical protein